MKVSKREKMLDILSAVCAIAVFLLVWQIATSGTRLGTLIPGPADVLKKLFESMYTDIGKNTMIEHSLISVRRVLTAYIAACITGIFLGLLMGWYPKIEAIFMPLFGVIRPIPPIAWTSLAILWFGLGEMPKYFIIFIAAFCNIVINAYDGARSVDQRLIGCARMLGARDNQLFLRIVLPSAVPYIFAGLQIALSNSWAAVIAAEMVRSSEGLGWVIITGMTVNNMEQIFCGIVMIGVIGLSLAAFMRRIEARLCIWNKSGV